MFHWVGNFQKKEKNLGKKQSYAKQKKRILLNIDSLTQQYLCLEDRLEKIEDTERCTRIGQTRLTHFKFLFKNSCSCEVFLACKVRFSH